MTILSEMYFQLVNGKILNIPQINKKIAPIKNHYKKKRTLVKKSYNRKRANLRKRVPAGDRLDRSLGRLQEGEDDEFNKLAAREKAALAPLMKQLELHNELLNAS